MRKLFKYSSWEDHGYGITLTVLSCEFLLLSIFIGVFKNSLLYDIITASGIIAAAFLSTFIAMSINKRYGVRGFPLIYGFIFWPWTLICVPKLIMKGEYDRKIKIVRNIIES